MPDRQTTTGPGKDGMLIFLGLLAVVCASGVGRAQQGACTVAVSVVTVLDPYPGEWAASSASKMRLPPHPLYQGPQLQYILDKEAAARNGKPSLPTVYIPAQALAPEDLIVRDGGLRIPVVSLQTDRGPRRIVLLVQNGTGTLGRGQAAQATAILSRARPEDAFALLAAGGPRLALPFGSGRDELRAAIEELSRPKPGGPKGEDVLDALLETTTWFGSPQAGDAILLLGDIGRQPRRRLSQLRSALISRRVRLFSLGGAYTVEGTDLYTEWSSPLLTISEGSGGEWESVGNLGPKAVDESLEMWEYEAKALYEVATFAYILRLARTGPHVRIELSQQAWNRLLWPRLSYPRPLPACPPPTAAASPEGQKTE